MFENRQKDSIISFSAKKKLDKIIRRYSDEDSPTVIEAYNNNQITENQLVNLVKVLEVNGYARKDLYDLPYSFASRLLGDGEDYTWKS